MPVDHSGIRIVLARAARRRYSRWSRAIFLVSWRPHATSDRRRKTSIVILLTKARYVCPGDFLVFILQLIQLPVNAAQRE